MAVTSFLLTWLHLSYFPDRAFAMADTKKPTVEDKVVSEMKEDDEDEWEDDDSEEEKDEAEDDDDCEEGDDEIDHDDVHELAIQTNALLMYVFLLVRSPLQTLLNSLCCFSLVRVLLDPEVQAYNLSFFFAAVANTSLSPTRNSKSSSTSKQALAALLPDKQI
jgi:hypothetical protein